MLQAQTQASLSITSSRPACPAVSHLDLPLLPSPRSRADPNLRGSNSSVSGIWNLELVGPEQPALCHASFGLHMAFLAETTKTFLCCCFPITKPVISLTKVAKQSYPSFQLKSPRLKRYTIEIPLIIPDCSPPSPRCHLSAYLPRNRCLLPELHFSYFQWIYLFAILYYFSF